ncbi:hypothetical protein SESBI_51354 [Sesbania bispinosa]|nr:hypothetical protein SESBI_51354 [Sesbania bispinosa]
MNRKRDAFRCGSTESDGFRCSIWQAPPSLEVVQSLTLGDPPSFSFRVCLSASLLAKAIRLQIGWPRRQLGVAILLLSWNLLRRPTRQTRRARNGFNNNPELANTNTEEYIERQFIGNLGEILIRLMEIGHAPRCVVGVLFLRWNPSSFAFSEQPTSSGTLLDGRISYKIVLREGTTITMVGKAMLMASNYEEIWPPKGQLTPAKFPNSTHLLYPVVES